MGSRAEAETSEEAAGLDQAIGAGLTQSGGEGLVGVGGSLDLAGGRANRIC